MAHADLDLIIIGRNEAWILERTLRAAKEATSRLGQELNLRARLIFVNDPQTTDQSAGIAQSQGAELYTGNPSYSRAGNNRMSGLILTSAPLVMLLDGDCLLDPGWLVAGVAYLNDHPGVGAVVGAVDLCRIVGSREVLVPNVGGVKQAEPLPSGTHTGSGSLLARRAALDAAGGIEPDLVPMQDVEVICELKAAGWGVHRIPNKMERHYQVHLSTFQSALSKGRAVVGNAFRMGSHLRHSIRRGSWRCLLPYFRQEFVNLIVMANSLFLLILSASLESGTAWILLSAVLVLFSYFVYETRRKGSVILALVSVVVLSVRGLGIAFGLLTGWPKIDWGAQNRAGYRTELFEANGLVAD